MNKKATIPLVALALVLGLLVCSVGIGVVDAGYTTHWGNEAKIEAGKTKTLEARIYPAYKNTNDQVKMSARGGVTNYIDKIEPKSFTLPPDETQLIKITVTAPRDVGKELSGTIIAHHSTKGNTGTQVEMDDMIFLKVQVTQPSNTGLIPPPSGGGAGIPMTSLILATTASFAFVAIGSMFKLKKWFMATILLIMWALLLMIMI